MMTTGKVSVCVVPEIKLHANAIDNLFSCFTTHSAVKRYYPGAN